MGDIPRKPVLTIKECQNVLGKGRTKIWQLRNSGYLKDVDRAGMTYILTESVNHFLETGELFKSARS